MINYNTVYNRKGKLLSNGTALVQIEANTLGKKKYFTTGIYLHPNEWDNKRKRVKEPHKNAIQLNKAINDFIARLQRIELDCINNGKPCTLSFLEDAAKGRLSNSFLDYMTKEVEQINLSPATKTGHKTTIKALREYRKEVLFDDLTHDFLVGFERFLYSKGLQTNTINKHFRYLKRYVNDAINRDFMDFGKYPFRRFKLKTEQTERCKLTIDELKRIEMLDLSDKPHLNVVKDMFLIGCYTGLRFSDVIDLKQNHIVKDGARITIEKLVVKTGDNIIIPVFALFDGKPISILEKYTENSVSLFKGITSQQANRTLKEIAELARIDKTISFHISRHSFASILLNRGMNITFVQSLLGHKKIQTTQVYAKTDHKAIINELQNIKYE